VLFQIPVEDANEAAFTPDGQHVVFTTETLRYEKWSVAERKPAEVRELVLRDDCWEHKLSPDGKYLACVDLSTNVNVLDTQTGKRVWEKKEFYRLDWFEYIMWLGSAARRGAGGDEQRPKKSAKESRAAGDERQRRTSAKGAAASGEPNRRSKQGSKRSSKKGSE
jgi:hypothetical protein